MGRLSESTPEIRIPSAANSSSEVALMSKISWRQVLPLALAAFFVVGSLSNIIAPGSIYQEYLKWGYPHWFHFVTGSLELTAAILLFRCAQSPVGLGARLHRHACRPRDRHHPRRIRARCATTCRGDMVTRGRLDKLAQAAHRLSVTDSTTIEKLALARETLDSADFLWQLSCNRRQLSLVHTGCPIGAGNYLFQELSVTSFSDPRTDNCP